MTWDDLTAEERVLADVRHVEAVRPDLVDVYTRVRAALWVDYVARYGCFPDGAGFARLDRAAAVAAVAHHYGREDTA